MQSGLGLQSFQFNVFKKDRSLQTSHAIIERVEIYFSVITFLFSQRNILIFLKYEF